MPMDVSAVSKGCVEPKFISRHSSCAHLTDGELLEQFVASRDERAFECLIDRHGPMVLGVCGRTLKNPADAEDAFQATFLVFVHKAASIRPRGMVGNWLYGVARNTALKARAMVAKRLAKEHEAVKRLPQTLEPNWSDLQNVLDQELNLLPDKYRAPIVLCDIEGNSLKDVARHLGCPMGTVGTRLARGRTMLARRLARRGVIVSVALLTMLLSDNAALAAVSPQLAATTLKAASASSAGAGTTAAIPPTVAALMAAVLKSLFMARLKVGMALLLALASVSFVGAATAHQVRLGHWPFNSPYSRPDGCLIQGNWTLVALSVAGHAVPPDQFKEYADWIIEDGRFTVASPSKITGTFTLNEAENPREIDMVQESPHISKVLPALHGVGIYQLEKRTLTICLADSAAVHVRRPSEFVSSGHAQTTSLFVFQRKHSGRCCDH